MPHNVHGNAVGDFDGLLQPQPHIGERSGRHRATGAGIAVVMTRQSHRVEPALHLAHHDPQHRALALVLYPHATATMTISAEEREFFVSLGERMSRR